jgi:hypothetical protein
LKRSVSSHQTSNIQVKTKKCGEEGLVTMGDHNFRPRPSHYHPHIQGGPQEQALPSAERPMRNFVVCLEDVFYSIFLRPYPKSKHLQEWVFQFLKCPPSFFLVIPDRYHRKKTEKKILIGLYKD